jgi:pyrimidine-specific ribonucleoside hydrolase
MRVRTLPVHVAIGLIVLMTLSGTTHAADPSAPASPELPARPVIIDTDMGQDDFMALAWLLRDPSLDILAITVSGTGLTHCDPGLDNLRAIIAFIAAARPEVGCGPDRPLGGGTPFPDDWRAFADALGGVALPAAPDAGMPSRPADEIIEAQLRTQVVPVTILTIGPMTTLADVLIADPGLAAEIGEVVAMGGALDVLGNVIPAGASTLGASEWNLHADPAAAATVLASGVPLTYVALDATQDAPMTAEIAASLADEHAAPGAWLAHALITHDPFLLSGDWFLWDPLAAGAMIDPTLITTVDVAVSIDSSGPDAGRMVRDDSHGHVVRVAIGGETARFTDAFLAGLRAAP